MVTLCPANSLDTPRVSCPKTSAARVGHTNSDRETAPCASARTIAQPCSRSALARCAGDESSSKTGGSANKLPAAPRTTFGFQTSAVPSVTKIRAAPRASPARQIVPTFPGSAIPSNTTTRPSGKVGKGIGDGISPHAKMGGAVCESLIVAIHSRLARRTLKPCPWARADSSVSDSKANISRIGQLCLSAASTALRPSMRNKPCSRLPLLSESARPIFRSGCERELKTTSFIKRSLSGLRKFKSTTETQRHRDFLFLCVSASLR